VHGQDEVAERVEEELAAKGLAHPIPAGAVEGGGAVSNGNGSGKGTGGDRAARERVSP
jgi:hypothetical protein